MSTLIHLWSEKMLNVIRFFLNALRLVWWPSIWFVLIDLARENSVYPAVGRTVGRTKPRLGGCGRQWGRLRPPWCPVCSFWWWPQALRPPARIVGPCVCSYGAGLSCTVSCEALLLVYRYLGLLCPLRSGPPCHSEAAFFILGHVPGSGTYLVW